MALDEAVLQSTTEQFRADGYVQVPSLGISAAEVRRAGSIMDSLFDRFAALPLRYAADLGGGDDRAHPILPEILDVSTLAPALRRTEVFAAAQELARRLLGPGTHLIYDHAIYKPPGQAGTTSWHQDSGYDPGLVRSLAIWIPFQDTSALDGAMRYVPRSHLAGPRPHATRIGKDGKEVKYLQVADSEAVDAPCALGGVTVHDLHTVHGAGPNLGQHVRRAWILDFTTAPLHQRAVRAVKQQVRARRIGSLLADSLR